MKCPVCGATETRVIETRSSDDGRVNRRRRVCPECETRFTTFERIEEKEYLWVVKKDGVRQVFDRQKLLVGMQHACEKLSIDLAVLEEAVSDIETKVKATGQGEIQSAVLGDMVAEHLRKINKVAYVRFASVYREFTDVSNFAEVVTRLLEEKENKNSDSGDFPRQNKIFYSASQK